MPGMDGFDVLNALKKDKIAPNAQIIMLTNQGKLSDIEKAKSIGISDFIVHLIVNKQQTIDDDKSNRRLSILFV